jgi:ATP-binding cassette, subfamily B, multidrug efflux pump
MKRFIGWPQPQHSIGCAWSAPQLISKAPPPTIGNSAVATAVEKYHEEEQIGKTYDLRIVRRLIGYLRPYWPLAAAALCLTFLTNVLVSLQPYFTKVAVDDFITPGRTEGIWLFAFAFFSLFLFRFIFSYVQEVLLNTVGQRVMFDLRSQIFSKLQRQEVAYYDKYPVGRIITRLTSDVDALNEMFTSGVIDVLGDMVVIIAIIGMMFWMDWKLAIASLVTVPLLFAATNWFRKHARRGFDRVRTRNAKLNAFLQEYISGAQTVQLLNAEDKARRRFHEINDDYRQANIETIYYYSVFYPLVDFIGAVGIAVVILFFGYEYLSGISAAQGGLTVGILASFIQYSLLLFQPIRDLSDKFNVLQAAIVASHRIFVLLDLDIEIKSPAEPKRTGTAKGRIEFRNVWFAYKENDWVLKDVSFSVEPGESIALVGHTGSGKTTVTNLLMRFYDVQKGRVLVGGVDVRDWDLHELRSNFAVVLQDVFLFSGTISDNIRLGDREISDERIRWAAGEVRADEFICHLDKGYDFRVRERGAGLSVGQKQLISFARALAFDPRVLILDEATSSIDTETEQLIQQAVERVMQGRTSFVVAHRLSTIQKCDRIMVFHHGELRELGTHGELLAARGLYWRLFQLQYADDEVRRKQMLSRPGTA